MRGLLAFSAGVLACLVLPFAVVATWTDAVVNDTDDYVETVAPLARDDRVQETVADRLTELATGFAPGSGFGSEAVIRQAALQVVETDTFAQTWRAANRAAHPQLLDLLQDGEGVRDDGEVTLDLGALVGQMLADLGVSPPTSTAFTNLDLTFTVARSEDLREARVAYVVVDPAGFWLPVAWLVLAALALLLAPRRMGAATWLAIGSAGGLAVLWLLIGIARAVFAVSLPSSEADLAEAVYDVVTSSLLELVVTLVGVSAVAAGVLVVAGVLFGRRSRDAVLS